MKNQDHYIPVANIFFREEEKLSAKELYAYSYLHTRRNYFSDSTKTNLALIMAEVQFVKKEQDNRKQIVDVLLSLRNKGIISFDFEDVRKDKMLDISFSFIEKGYEKIPYSVFRMTSDPEEYMVLCYVLKINRSISFFEFASILGCSVTHAKSMIADMEERLLLNIAHGRFYVNDQGLPRNEMNSYQVNQNFSNVPQVSGESEDVKQEVSKSDTQEQEDRPHNWYDDDVYINADDCYIFLTTKDKKLKNHAQKRITRISKNGFGKKKLDEHMETAQGRLEEEEMKRKQVEEKEKMLSMTGTPVELPDGRKIECSAENVEQVDFKQYRVSVYYMDKNGEMNSFRIHGDLFDGGRFYPETIELVLNELKNQIAQGKLTQDNTNKIKQLLRETVKKNNEGKQYNEDMEGDYWEGFSTGNGVQEENRSKRDRIWMKNQRERSERQRKENEEHVKDMLSLLD